MSDIQYQIDIVKLEQSDIKGIIIGDTIDNIIKMANDHKKVWESYLDLIINKTNTKSYVSIISDKYKYSPILYIDESIHNHIVQILYILKDSYISEKDGFMGWKPFTREYLEKIINDSKDIYIKHYYKGSIIGTQFFNEIINKIDYFIENYCIKLEK